MLFMVVVWTTLDLAACCPIPARDLSNGVLNVLGNLQLLLVLLDDSAVLEIAEFFVDISVWGHGQEQRRRFPAQEVA